MRPVNLHAYWRDDGVHLEMCAMYYAHESRPGLSLTLWSRRWVGPRETAEHSWEDLAAALELAARDLRNRENLDVRGL